MPKTATSMPHDKSANPMPVVTPVNGSKYKISGTAGSSVKNTVDIADDVIGIYTPVPVYLKFGDNTVVASDTDYDVFMDAGNYREYHFTQSNTHIAAFIAPGGGNSVIFVNGLV